MDLSSLYQHGEMGIGMVLFFQEHSLDIRTYHDYVTDLRHRTYMTRTEQGLIAFGDNTIVHPPSGQWRFYVAQSFLCQVPATGCNEASLPPPPFLVECVTSDASSKSDANQYLMRHPALSLDLLD